jgi:histidinol-phosphate phosphatase family protein
MAHRDITWVVLAGGLGSRSENPNLPKILQQVGEFRILDFLLDSLLDSPGSEVIFVTKHKAEDVESALRRRGDSPWKFQFHRDSGYGPVSALVQVKDKIRTKHVGIILGDTLISAPLGALGSKYISSGYTAGITVRQSDHLPDSDTVTLDLDGKIQAFFSKTSPRSLRTGQIWGITGLLFMHREDIPRLDSNATDLAKAIFNLVEQADQVLAIRTSFYFRDSGTKERIHQIRKDFSSGLLVLPRKTMPRACLFIDRDGTLLPDMPKGRTSVGSHELNSAAVEYIRKSNAQGLPVFLVTNQPSIAKGFRSFEDVYQTHNSLQSQLLMLGARLDDFYFCPHHPQSGFEGEVTNLKIDCRCRKPGTALFERAKKDHCVLLDFNSYLVGDSANDELAAELLGLNFIDVKTLNA